MEIAKKIVLAVVISVLVLFVVASVRWITSESVIDILASQTFWIALGSAGAVVTLVLTYLQLRASRIIAAADFLLKLERTFGSTDMLKKRDSIMRIRKNTPDDFKAMDESREVFEFFEDLGLLLRKKVVMKELVWSDYCYWIEHYWVAFQGYFDWVRKNDSDLTLYCEFEYLFKQIHAYDERRRKGKVVITAQLVQEFLDDEIKRVSRK